MVKGKWLHLCEKRVHFALVEQVAAINRKPTIFTLCVLVWKG